MRRAFVVVFGFAALAFVLAAGTLSARPSFADGNADNFGGIDCTDTSEECSYKVNPDGTGSMEIQGENSDEEDHISLGQNVASGVAERQ